jgi:hypothetical protein
MMLVQIATALAIGAYVVLSKDVQPKRTALAPESFGQMHLAQQRLVARIVVETVEQYR